MTDERESAVPDAAGMPPMDPPAGGPNADPDSPDPSDLMPPRPGTPPEDVDTESSGS